MTPAFSTAVLAIGLFLVAGLLGFIIGADRTSRPLCLPPRMDVHKQWSANGGADTGASLPLTSETDS